MTAEQFIPPRSHPLHPPEILRELRARDPISKVSLWDGRKVWLVTRYEDIRFILRDSRFSADIAKHALPSMSPGRTSPRRTLSKMDDPRHAEIRRMLANDFLAGRIDQMRSDVERIVMAQIDRLLRAPRPADLHGIFASSVPSQVIIEVLGMPSAAQRLFQRCTEVLMSRTATKEEYSAADGELYSLCVRIVTQKEAEPTDDLLSRLVQSEVRTGRLSHEEAYITTMFLLAAAHETTANSITLGVLMMLLDPELFRTMREQSELAANAVEELLRFQSPMHDGVPRIATEDVQVGDTLISAGEGVVLSLVSANRDESVFKDPDKFDIRRDSARRHLTFGHGIHQCLGKWLARAELQITLPALATRIPTLRLAVPFEELSFKEDSHVYGVRELPVTW